MEIGSTTSASKAASSVASTQPSNDAAAPTTDFQTFLTLLTAQMRNQDPMKPMESTEFVAQLASFSSVEQQVRANDRLDGIRDLLAGGQADGLAAWIGKEVRAPGKVSFDGEPVEVQVTPVDAADRAVLVVTNDFGQVVARQAAEASGDTVTWSGMNDLGAAAAEGLYSFKLESYKGDKLVDTQEGRVFNTVSEVRLEDGAAQLILASGSAVAVSDVTGLR